MPPLNFTVRGRMGSSPHRRVTKRPFAADLAFSGGRGELPANPWWVFNPRIVVLRSLSQIGRTAAA
jgi:hypothetical protein